MQRNEIFPHTKEQIENSLYNWQCHLHINVRSVQDWVQRFLLIIQIYASRFEKDEQYADEYYSHLWKHVDTLNDDFTLCLKGKLLNEYYIFKVKNLNTNHRKLINIRDELVATIYRRHRKWTEIYDSVRIFFDLHDAFKNRAMESKT